MEQYMKVLKSHKRMAPELELYLRENVKPVTFKKNDIIQQEGTLCDHIYFLERGLIRGFLNVGPRQVTIWFKKENDFVVSIEEILGKLDEYNTVIEALEDSVLWAFPADLVDRLIKKFVEFNYHLMVMMMNDMVRMDKQDKLNHANMTSRRYDYLRQESPDLLTRVPVKHLASFVGMSIKAFEHMDQNLIYTEMSSRRRARKKI